jgi:hypothetical protein
MEIVPISVSLHSSQAHCLTRIDRVMDPEILFSLRVFWTWFFYRTHLPLCWQAFAEFLLRKTDGTSPHFLANNSVDIWPVFTLPNVLQLIANYLNKANDPLHFVIHIDDINEAHDYDVLSQLGSANASDTTFYRILKGIGKGVFSSRGSEFFVTPILTGTTQIYMNLVFQASDFSALQERLSLLSSEDAASIVTKYAGSTDWKTVHQFVACVEAVQVQPIQMLSPNKYRAFLVL